MKNSGILLIDKPCGPSSASVNHMVKKTLGLKKAGHAGSLDPFASGLMLICANKATRISRYFLEGDKRYQASLSLGCSTDTLDVKGEITEKAPLPSLKEEDVKSVLDSIKGPQMQSPPVYSALKHKGQPLYKLARMGKPVEKPARPIDIYDIELLKIEEPDKLHFTVHCSAGTYIRTLASDIAKALGSLGYLSALRRTASSDFSIEDAVKTEDLKDYQKSDKLLIPVNTALGFLPEVKTNNALTEKIFHGKVLSNKDLPEDTEKIAGPIRISDEKNNLLAVVRKGEEGFFSYDIVFPY